MSYQEHSKCIRERITDALLTAGLTGREAIDCAGWLAGLPEGHLPHLDALCGEGAQLVMEQIENEKNLHALAEHYRAVRRTEGMYPTPEQRRMEDTQWRRF
ncbi:hypothetical protein [Deinococcus humi]|uniref:Uncharacterized protein n=1 Tax=Deinococcus humi TaxID=662880 RepID=A0A7W8JTH7_9DEIO|nr:hypothetical protein [Deinococcus humi]MBB5361374.1 hypothetical protein [Deinococcus humi]GGO19753.1 hypothetical protein GCM10008949_04360 [Deinococcus humi]